MSSTHESKRGFNTRFSFSLSVAAFMPSPSLCPSLDIFLIHPLLLHLLLLCFSSSGFSGLNYGGPARRQCGGARRTGISVTLEETPSDSGLNNDKWPRAELQITPLPPTGRYKIWMDQEEEEQISSYQAEQCSNDAGRGACLILFRGNRFKFRSGFECCSLFSIRKRKSAHSWSGLLLIIPEHSSASWARPRVNDQS